MQIRWLLVLTCFVFCLHRSSGNPHILARLRRQATPSSLLSLTTTSNIPSVHGPPVQSSILAMSVSSTATTSVSSSSSLSSSSSSSSRISAFSSSIEASTASTPSTTALRNGSSTVQPTDTQGLPIQPHITPALSIAGVILILSGATHALVGIKNRWIQIFLSCASLASVSVLVLIEYVMHPPVSNAVQGVYFVAVFMTGCLFGGGALIFQEVTEGLGCLLGGFCLGMWFLTLKQGGTISGSTGVGVFLAIFCVVGWSLSFSRYTRDYALIGSTSFAGATAFTLGIDCYSRAGYKEFWFYIWNLNGDLFPLNTDTYPLAHGVRVEIAVIIIGTIVGVISQSKLWKVIKERRREKEALRLEEESRRDAVDEALGRHLQQQNATAKKQWEKIYGDYAGRPRVMINPAMNLGDQTKRGSYVSFIRTRMHSGLGLQSQVVELQPVNLSQVSTISKKQSTVSVCAIGEEHEEHEQTSQNRSATDMSARSLDIETETQADDEEKSDDTTRHSEPSLTEASIQPNTTAEVSSVNIAKPGLSKQAGKQRSSQSFLKRLSGESINPRFRPMSSAHANISQEVLVTEEEVHHSRPSSVVATLDEDRDKPDASRLSVFYGELIEPPEIVVSTAPHAKDGEKESLFLVPPSPSALSVEFDPEEMTRFVPHAASTEVMKSASSSGSAAQYPNQITEMRKSLSQENPVDVAKTSLTTEALEMVPTRLSNVVLSHRTNEWAKHITSADAPVTEEPQNVSGDDTDELPTEVLSSVVGARMEPHSSDSKVSEKCSSMELLPTLDMPSSAASQPEKLRDFAERQDTAKSIGPSGLPDLGSLQMGGLMQNRSTGDLSRATFKTRSTVLTGRGLRSTSTPILGQSLVTLPIEENVEASFPQPKNLSATSSPRGSAIFSAQRANLLHNQSMQRSQSYQDLPLRPFVQRSSSQQTRQKQREMNRPSSRKHPATRDTSVMNSSSVENLDQHMNLSTRLNTYNSRQPIRQSTALTPQQRHSTLANWRTSMRQEISVAEHPEQTMAQRRADMLAQKAKAKRNERRQSNIQASREDAINVLMRRGDMQDAHRAAMRRMQATVHGTVK